jgi:hypothetical protein
MPARLSRLLLPAAGWLLCLSLPALGQEKAIDTDRSVLTVRVFKSGLFSFLAHDHTIKAPVASGTFDEQSPRVQLTVQSAALKVMDPDVSDKDRGEIQATMVGPKVLDPQKFPEIRFQSTSVDSRGADKWLVRGDLTLHGQTRPVAVEVHRENGRYFGSTTLKQSDFGITPITIGGGAVKVKDEVRIDFEIAGRQDGR